MVQANKHKCGQLAFVTRFALVLVQLVSMKNVLDIRTNALSSPNKSNQNNIPIDRIRVCRSSTCSSNGSEIFLDALQSLQTKRGTDQTNEEDDRRRVLNIGPDNCLGGCGKGIVVKIGATTKRQAVQAISSEQDALDVAATLLRDVDALDDNEMNRLSEKLANGERIFEPDPPELCARCGVGLQLYRGNCAKCGKYPY